METPVPLRLTGIAASPGIAIGAAHCLHDIPVPQIPSLDGVTEGELLAELAALEEAIRLATRELEAICNKVASQLGTDEVAIFHTHWSILNDHALLDKVRRVISDRGLTALAALSSVMGEYEQVFSRVEDEYLKERVTDLRDVLQRVGKHLTKSEGRFKEPLHSSVILVAHELLPSDVVAITECDVLGIVTQSGGRTSHAAILARSYGIPSVAGVSGILEAVNSGDSVIVDGRAGHIFVHPGDETLRSYQKQRREYVRLTDRLAHEPAGPVLTADGTGLQLLANVSCVEDAQEAKREGAQGIGLYRTEFYILTHPGMPSEDEQFAEYRAVIEASPDGPMTIRTLDLGGDKTIPYLTHSREANPFMGWRSIRLSFEHPDFFLQQIRAILRVAHNSVRPIRALFPMITTWEELKLVRQFMADARDELHRHDQPYGLVEIGAMIEVPAAAVMIDHLLEHVDFVSIGTNDLVQYLTAADRDNPKVNHLCQALSPAVIRVVRSVIGACRTAEKDVTVCGEMAGSPRAFPLLLGMGLRSFSMSPAFIPVIRDLARHVKLAEAKDILAATLELRTPSEIQELLDDYVGRVRPEVVPLLLN